MGNLDFCAPRTSSYIKFLIRVNFDGDLHLDVSRCQIKLTLKVKTEISLSMVEQRNTLCNPYIQGTTYVACANRINEKTLYQPPRLRTTMHYIIQCLFTGTRVHTNIHIHEHDWSQSYSNPCLTCIYMYTCKFSSTFNYVKTLSRARILHQLVSHINVLLEHQQF